MIRAPQDARDATARRKKAQKPKRLVSQRAIWQAVGQTDFGKTLWGYRGVCRGLWDLCASGRISEAVYQREKERMWRARPVIAWFWWPMNTKGDQARRDFCLRMETAK